MWDSWLVARGGGPASVTVGSAAAARPTTWLAVRGNGRRRALTPPSTGVGDFWKKDGRGHRHVRLLVATEELFVVKKVHVNVGTIGHIDHGKTTLTAAILAVQAAKGLARRKSYQAIARGGLATGVV